MVTKVQTQFCLKSKAVGGNMKKVYRKPQLKALGLLRVVTQLSSDGDGDEQCT